VMFESVWSKIGWSIFCSFVSLYILIFSVINELHFVFVLILFVLILLHLFIISKYLDGLYGKKKDGLSDVFEGRNHVSLRDNSAFMPICIYRDKNGLDICISYFCQDEVSMTSVCAFDKGNLPFNHLMFSFSEEYMIKKGGELDGNI